MRTTPVAPGTQGEPGQVLAGTITLVRRLTDDHDMWNAPLAASMAGAELAAQESRLNTDRPTGSWPWLAAHMIARQALQSALEFAGAFAVLPEPARASGPGAVLCRSVLEYASLAFWLLDPDIDGEDRLARSLVYRAHTAKETRRAIDRLNLADGEDRTGYEPDDVAAEIGRLGPAWAYQPNSDRISHDGRSEPWVSPTDRVAALVRSVWPGQERLPYALLSTVVHAELLGLSRDLDAPDPTRGSRPDPATSAQWRRHDATLILGVLVVAGERAAGFLGRPDHGDILRSHAAEVGLSLPPRH